MWFDNINIGKRIVDRVFWFPKFIISMLLFIVGRIYLYGILD